MSKFVKERYAFLGIIHTPPVLSRVFLNQLWKVRVKAITFYK
jgi:hypothetical protein